MAAAFPSLASIIMWLVTHNLLIASTWRPQARVKWGLVFLGVDILGVIFLIASKVVVMTTCNVKGTDAATSTNLKGTECLKFKTQQESTDRASTLRSWGYHLQDEVDDPQAKEYAFGFNQVASLTYECLLLVWYLACVGFYTWMNKTIRRLRK